MKFGADSKSFLTLAFCNRILSRRRLEELEPSKRRDTVRYLLLSICTLIDGDKIVRQSILDAIKSGNWNYEPDEASKEDEFDSTRALPGSGKKLEVLADRIQSGMPLWHPEDRLTYGIDEE